MSLPVRFDGSGSYDLDGTILTYEWDFGDGNTGLGVSPTHTYTASGQYTVMLTVTDDGTLTGAAYTTAAIGLVDTDGDGVHDGVDNCIYTPNPSQLNNDSGLIFNVF